jgi:NMT1-like family
MKTSLRWPGLGQRVGQAEIPMRRPTLRTSRFGAFRPAFAGLLIVAAPLAAHADPSPPAGMVLYNHPVFHNGHRVLWRGAWRGHGGGKAEETTSTATPPQPKNVTSVAPQSPVSSPAEYSIIADADDVCATRLANEFVAALQADGMKGRVIAGRTSPAAIAKAVAGDSADLAIAPMDVLIGNEKATEEWRERAPYVARLGNETIEIVAPRSVTDIKQLGGRDVDFGVADGAASASVAMLFSRLGVTPKPAFEPLQAALTDLGDGKLSAVAVVSGKTASLGPDFGKDGRFHVISVPWSSALQSLYAPARLTAKDAPNLVGADEKIDTVSVPMALIALDAAPSSPRSEEFGTLTKTFFEGFDKLLGPDNDLVWRDVNLAAAAPAWPRLRAAQAWIDLNANASSASLNAFRAIAKTVASANGGPGAEDSDRLYDSLMQWRGGSAMTGGD